VSGLARGRGRAGWVARACLLALALTALPVVALAHPMGNFSISHFDGLTATPDLVRLDRVLDIAEVPTFDARRAMDSDHDGEVSDREAVVWAALTCAEAAGSLILRQDGDELEAQSSGSSIGFPPGQGSLTIRLECRYDYALAHPLGSGGSAFAFYDRSYPDRTGWREIVVTGEGTTIEHADVPDETISDRLLRYPTDPLIPVPDAQAASWVVRAAAGSGASVSAAASTMSGDRPGTATGAEGAFATDVGALLSREDLDLAGLLLALATAVALGILHALSPGHGKTIMAAYLLGSRGTVRTAVGLGLVVAFAHTAGVLALALLTLGASNVLPVERLYPVLGFASGVIVIGLGAWLLWQRLARWHAAPAVVDDHGHARHEHESGHDHEHDHDHDHGYGHDDHDHASGSDHTHPASHGHPLEHGHGPFRHRHEVPASGTGWRGLAALGLAGGLVPSVSALVLVLGAVSVGRPDLGVLLTLAFGVGMAVVLGGIGIVAVVGGGVLTKLGRTYIPGRLVTAVPTAAAGLVLVAGLVMTAQAVQTLGVTLHI
jgi:ABC-type nickel/cobalt efflux system permease component RcnA